MPSLFDPTREREVLERLQQLTPEHRRRWGRMTVGEMLSHLIDYFDVALGRKKGRRMLPRLMQVGVRPILVHWPFRYPRNVRTLPELLQRPSETFEIDRRQLVALIQEFAGRREHGHWPENPVAGRCTGPQWAKLAYGHVNHHLIQFGV